MSVFAPQAVHFLDRKPYSRSWLIITHHLGEVEFQLLPHPHSLDFDWILVLLTNPALGTFLVLCKPHPRHTHTLFSPILFLRRIDLHLFIFSFSKFLLFFSSCLCFSSEEKYPS